MTISRVAIVRVACLALVLTQALHSAATETTASATHAFDERAFQSRRTQLAAGLRDALTSFDRELGADIAPCGESWHEYLSWSDWAEPFLSGEAADAAAMQRISWRFYAADKGFEQPVVMAARDALTDYLSLEEAVRLADGDLQAEFARRLSTLEAARRNEDIDYHEYADAAWWLAATGQADEALAEFAANHDGPAIVVQVHRDLVEEKLQQFEKTSKDVRDEPLEVDGARMLGKRTITTKTTAQLVDVDGEARLRIASRGEVDAPNNVSRNGSVRVHTSSHSNFEVAAEIFWGETGVSMTPPTAEATTVANIEDIESPRFFEYAANKRAKAIHETSERNAEAQIEQEAVAAMTERGAAALEKINAKTENFLNFMTRTGNRGERIRTGLSETAAFIGFAPRSLSGVTAAPHEMPPMVGEQTLGLSIHDSGIESVLRALVAGKTWTDVNFSQLQRELTGGNSEEFLIGLEPDRWNAQWDWRHPVRIHFTPEYATVRYRFSRVEIDGAVYEAPFEVSARMTVAAPPIGFEMTLLEPATVVSLDAARSLPPHVQALLDRKFRGLFGQKFALDGMQFPAGGALDGMSVFRVSAISLEPNWVHLRYTNRAPQPRVIAMEAAAGNASASISP